MEMSVKDRLIKFLEVKKISKSEFGRRIGVSSAYITSMRQSMQPAKVQRIALEFPDLNTTWLLTGEGPMLKGPSTSTAPADSENVSIDRQAWEVIRSQAASLERKDKQMDELLALLREEMKRGEDADYRGHAATGAAAD